MKSVDDALAALLTFIVTSVASTVIIYWHTQTRGSWRHWPAGRSLMGLLGIIAFGFGFGTINRIIGEYPGRGLITIGLYAIFVAGITFIGLTIRSEMRAGKRRALKSKSKYPTHDTAVNVIVASENKENPDGNQQS